MQLRIHLPDGLATTGDEHEPGDQFERNQPVARRRLVDVQHQSGIEYLELIDVQGHLKENGNADEDHEPSDLRRRQNALGDGVAEREQQHEHRVQGLGVGLEQLGQQIGVRRRHAPQAEINVAINFAQHAQQLAQQGGDEQLVGYVQQPPGAQLQRRVEAERREYHVDAGGGDQQRQYACKMRERRRRRPPIRAS